MSDQRMNRGRGQFGGRGGGGRGGGGGGQYVGRGGGSWNQSYNNRPQYNRPPGQYNRPPAGQFKKKWTPDDKVFDGSIGEGQGFAFKRKLKVQREYRKMLSKERRRKPEVRTAYEAEQYPENLRHLYVAEAEEQRTQARNNRLKRVQLRMRGREEKTEGPAELDVPAEPEPTAGSAEPEPPIAGPAEPKPTAGPVEPEEPTAGPAEEPEATAGAAEMEQAEDAASDRTEPTVSKETENVPMSNRMKKKMTKMTSFQKTKEEFERVQENKRTKREEFLKNKQQREEAIQKYNQKKKETYQMLSKKTKRGQPNLNLQMEFLLQKIQGSSK